jgi:glutathione S-transferase
MPCSDSTAGISAKLRGIEMKIWGRANSMNVMKVLWTADECGLKYERIDVGLAFGGNDQKWYLDMNPNGVVPTIDDDGRVIWESNTVVRYLAA